MEVERASLRDMPARARRLLGAYEGLRERFTEVARQSGGWYDEPGDDRPPAP